MFPCLLFIMIPSRYRVSAFIKAIKNPNMFIGEFNRLLTAINQKWYQQRSIADCTTIFEEDWDNLIILDACRYDVFSDKNFIHGQLKERKSCGSNSREFMKSNFVGENHHDTVYITANAHADKLDDSTFHDVFRLYIDDWDSSIGTVHPSKVARVTEKVNKEYENKRIISHFMQPHAPFIGETGQSITDTAEGPTTWHQLRYGMGVTLEDVREAYKENLEIVLNEVKETVQSISGKNVITSDHGELLGERLRPIPVRGYEHNPNLYHDNLLRVPWLVIDSKDRKNIEPEPPVSKNKESTDVVDERLRSLGYK